MNQALNIFFQALVIGAITLLIGFIVFRMINPEQSVKIFLVPLFITGALLFIILEISGAHKSFCTNYLKSN